MAVAGVVPALLVALKHWKTRMKDFNQKLALITGGSSGIGLAIAKQLASLGANIAIMARRPEQLRNAKQEIEQVSKYTKPVEIVRADVSNEQEVTIALERFVNQTGIPDLLIHSAGVTQPGLFHEQATGIFRWIMDINYFGSLYVTKALIGPMRSKKAGHVVFISSIAGLVGVYGYTAYCASKFAIRGLAEALRSELKFDGIGVTIVYPPDTNTPQLEYEKPFKPPITKALASLTGILQPEVVARATVKGIQKNRFIVTPGFEASFWYAVSTFAGPGLHKLMDMLTLWADHQVKAGKF